jgi:hypothetical protein
MRAMADMIRYEIERIVIINGITGDSLFEVRNDDDVIAALLMSCAW